MKELSIEQKAKRYDEAIEKAKSKIKNDKDHVLYEEDITDIFPALKRSKESEDEIISKEIIKYLERTVPHNHRDEVLKSKEWIAWLEKQGEHANFINKIQIGDKVTRNEDGVLVNLSQLNRVAKKQGEQKPSITIPKFKVGDKVYAFGDGFECTIESIDETCYYGDTTNFDIKDQDDWELIEQKPWSEEDESVISLILSICNDFLESFEISPASTKVVKEDIDKIENWLKSLKERYTWKPSDEHYELEEFAKIVRDNLMGISRVVIERLEAKYLQLTGNKLYKGFID